MGLKWGLAHPPRRRRPSRWCSRQFRLADRWPRWVARARRSAAPLRIGCECGPRGGNTPVLGRTIVLPTRANGPVWGVAERPDAQGVASGCPGTRRDARRRPHGAATDSTVASSYSSPPSADSSIGIPSRSPLVGRPVADQCGGFRGGSGARRSGLSPSSLGPGHSPLALAVGDCGRLLRGWSGWGISTFAGGEALPDLEGVGELVEKLDEISENEAANSADIVWLVWRRGGWWRIRWGLEGSPPRPCLRPRSSRVRAPTTTS